MTGLGPWWLFPACVAATVFCVMFGIGLGVAPGDLRRVWNAPGPVARGLFCVVVAVPILAFAVVRLLDPPLPVQAGILLMAIAPGAPVALRRSLDASGHRSFAPALQVFIALLAVLAVPLWIGVLAAVYGAEVSIDPREVFRQVLLAQLLPLGLGTGCRGLFPALASRVEPHANRAGNLLLVLTVLLGLASLGEATLRTGTTGLLACVATSCAALAAGHLLGGPRPETRTAVAIISAARNPGLALLVAALNAAQPRVVATILAYLVVSILCITLYALRRRTAKMTA